MKIERVIDPAQPAVKAHFDPWKLFKKAWTAWYVQIVLLAVAFLAGALVYRSGALRPLTQQVRQVARNAVQGALPGPLADVQRSVLDEVRMYQNNGLPTLYIDMPFKSYQQIVNKRDEALKVGILISSDADYVPADVQLEGGQKLNAEIRLKGDWTDHLQGDKWSFRIHIKDDGQILHFRQFSIQSPETREYLREWAFHQILMDEGILTTRYQFINVMLNGKLLGIYAIEENFAPELIESQGRRQGVIVRFNEELMWENRANLYAAGVQAEGAFETTNLDSADITPFQESRIAKDPVLSQQAKTAEDLLRAYQTGERPASQVFDLPLLGRFLALSDLWDACHGTYWHNLRFYYNPITTLLEPVPFDNEPFQWCETQASIAPTLVQMSLFKDPEIRVAYAQELARITQPGYVEAIQEKLTPEHDALQKSLRVEYPGVDTGVPWDLLAKRAISLRTELHPAQAVRANYQAVGLEPGATIAPDLKLDLTNLMILPVEVLRVEVNGQALPVGDSPVVLPQVSNPTNQSFEPVRVSVLLAGLNLGQDPPEVKVIVRLQGLAEEMAVTASGTSVPEPLLVGPLPALPSLSDAMQQHAFLVNPKGDRSLLMVQPGDWLVQGDLILPASTNLIIPEGTTLRFAPGAVLLANGAVNLLGTADAPVVLTSQTDAGWGGIVVLRSTDESTWQYATIEKTAGISRNGWDLTGGITFFQSKIYTDHVRIGNNHTEDGINVVHGQFRFYNTEFYNTFSDAFDSDFSTGEIANCNFHDVGADAVDVSGTTATVRDTRIERTGDKGVSVGEQSDITVQRVTMNDVRMGVTSKDLSKAFVTQTTISNARYAALAAYIKKPVFGPASITAPDVTILNTQTEAVAQTGNTILLRGQLVPTVELDVARLYAEGILGN